jgi:hypothetical protein
MFRRDLFHVDNPEACEACRRARLHTELELQQHHANFLCSAPQRISAEPSIAADPFRDRDSAEPRE